MPRRRLTHHHCFSNLIRRAQKVPLGLLSVILLFFFVLIVSLFSKRSSTPAFQKAGLFSGWEYQAFSPQSNIVVSTKTTSKTGVIDFKYHNSSIEFQLPLSGSSIKRTGTNQIEFVTSQKNITPQYQVLPNGLKENIILSKIPSTNEFQSSFKVTNADIYLTTDNLPVFFDPKTKQYLFHVQKPYAFDAKGNKTFGVSYQINSLPTKDKNHLPLLGSLTKLNSSTQYTLTLKIDSKWLFDKSRVYPITIDPTIVHDQQSEFASGSFNRIKDLGAGDTAPSLETNYQELSADQYTIALWHLNESVGTTVADSSGNNYTGTLTGTTTASGILGNSRNFNGTSDAVTIPAGISNLSSGFTVELWAKPTASNNFSRFIDIGNTSGTGAVNLVFYRSGTSSNLNLYSGDGSSANAITATNAIINNEWHHYAGTIDRNGFASIYRDGILLSSGNLPIPASVSRPSNYIGKSNWAADAYYAGFIDEVRISNIARSAEEIRMDASRRPYGVYTSPVIDIGSSSTPVQWNSLTWTAAGNATGNGETPSNSTGLVAQWDFNESSGIGAAATGSCGSNCSGILNNFSNTTSQDSIPLSGWSAIHKRWGAGSLGFDGIDDYINVPDHSTLHVGGGPFTLETWIKPNELSTRHTVFSTRRTNAAGSWQLEVGSGSGGIGRVSAVGVGTWIFDSVDNAVKTGVWNHIVYTRSSNSDIGTMYVNGQAVSAGTTTAYTIINNTDNKLIGTGTNLTTFFPGFIDTTRLYSRVLTPAEILSNYNSSRVELQTRAGSSPDPNDGTWEDWKPSSTETSVDSLDSYSSLGCSGGTISEDGRLHKFTTVGSSSFTCTSSGNVEVLVVAGGGGGGANMGGGGGGGGVIYRQFYPVTANVPVTVTVGAGGAGAPAGTTYNTHPSVPASNGGNSVFGTLTAIGGGAGGTSHNGMGVIVNGNAGGSGGGASGYNSDGAVPGAHPGGAGTIGQGYRGGNQGTAYYSGGGGGAGGPGTDGNNQANGGPGFYSNILGPGYYWGGGGGGGGYTIGGGNGGIGGGGGGAAGVTFGGAGLNNGSPGGGGCTGCWTQTPGGDGGVNTGGGGGGGSHYFSNNKGGNGGSGIVVVRVSPLSFTKDTNLKTEGVGSQKISFDPPSVDANTSSIWHLDESSGTLKSSTTAPFATGGVVTTYGNYTVHTFYSSGTLAINSNGNVDVLVVAGGGGGGSDMGGGGGGGGVIYSPNFSVSAGIYPVTVGAGGAGAPAGANQVRGSNGGNSIFSSLTAIGGGGGGSEYNTATAPASSGGSGGGTAGCNNGGPGSGTAGQGYAGGPNGGCYYPSGGGGAGGPGFTNPANGGVGVTNSINGTNLYWGAGGAGAGYSNIAGIGGSGGGGGGAPLVSGGGLAGSGGLGIGQPGTAGTLGAQTNVPGGYGAANTGSGGGGGSHYNSNNAGGAGGSGIVIVRYLTSLTPVNIGNSGTATGTTAVQGISGLARKFNGSSDYISLGNSTNYQNLNSLTVEAWINPASFASTWGIVNKHRAGYTTGTWTLRDGDTDKTKINISSYGANCTSANIYINGQLAGSGTSGATSSFSLSLNTWQHVAAILTGCTNLGTNSYNLGLGYLENNSGSNVPSLFFNGKIDEVKISTVARSADEIAEDYRNGANSKLSRVITPTDFSSQGKFSLNVASNRPGTFLESTVGNNAFANYESDSDTLGLWHFEETAGSGAFLKDSSGNNNHGTANTIFNYTGGDQTYTVPAGVYSLTVKEWGGGGGGGNAGGWSYGFAAGGGGYTTASLAVTPGQALTVMVGGGGANGAIATTIPTYGGGARGCNTSSNCRYGGAGGGRSAIRSGGVDLITAGGGGGGGSSRVANGQQGGAGGGIAGIVGKSYTAAYAGGGGTQSAGGAAGTGASAGAQYAGGNPASNAYGGGGGGGWYGGGGGGYLEPNDMGGGGGGSGYISGAGVSRGTLVAAVGATQANVADPDNLGAGAGGLPSVNGTAGKVIIQNSTTSIPGKIGKARTFNGVNEQVNAGPGINLVNSSFTLMSWAKIGATSTSFNPILSLGTSAATNNILHFGIRSTNVFTCAFYGNDLNTTTTYTDVNDWHLYACTYDATTKTRKIYVDGVLQASAVTSSNFVGTGNFYIGSYYNSYFFKGSIDEVRVDDVVRSASDIRQAYEAGKRNHAITIDFGASLSAGTTLFSSSVLSFSIDATVRGLNSKGANLYPGDTLIISENIGGTNYTAQGLVNSINVSTGAVSVSNWVGTSTFPSSGFSSKADVFKWQKEYFDLTGISSDDINSVSYLSFRLTDSLEDRNIWLDDIRSTSSYLNNAIGSTISSALGNRYFQYRAIESTNDYNVSAKLNQVALDYHSNLPPTPPTQSSPFNGETNKKSFFSFKLVSTDPEGDPIQYKIKLCTDLAMSTNCQTFDQNSSNINWSGQNVGTSAYSSGTTATYTFTSALSYNTNYYWQAWAINPTTSNTWSLTQATPSTFATSFSPGIPSHTSMSSNQPPQPVFSLSAIDPDSDYLRYKISICSDMAMSVNCQTFDQNSTQAGWSGQNAQSNTSYLSGSLATYSLQTTLPLNSTFYWQSWAIDKNGSNLWSSTQSSPSSFTTTPIIPYVFDGCLIEESNHDDYLKVKWVGTTDPNVAGYSIQRSVDSGAFGVGTTIGVGTTSYTDTTVTQGHTYRYRVAPFYSGPVYGNWCTTSTLNLRSGSVLLDY